METAESISCLLNLCCEHVTVGVGVQGGSVEHHGQRKTKINWCELYLGHISFSLFNITHTHIVIDMPVVSFSNGWGVSCLALSFIVKGHVCVIHLPPFALVWVVC